MKYKYPKYIEKLIKEVENRIRLAYHEGVSQGLKQASEIMEGKKKN